jgi:hypothetical protein
MWPTFASPLAFLALLSIPALVAIYWLRIRSRPYSVSSLILWSSQRRVRDGGTLFDRLQTPLLFFLELLVLLLLALAAAGPPLATRESVRPLVVVLDDSYSMLAGDPDSPRSRAITALERELGTGLHSPVRFILAGLVPRALAEPVASAAAASALLQSWECNSPSSDLDKALALAFQLAPRRGRILVLTDRPGIDFSGADRLQYWAFGSSRSNVAFVNAGRASLDGRERCFLEIANFSANPIRTTLTFESDQDSQLSSQSIVELSPHQTFRMLPEVKPDTRVFRARLNDDALKLDNDVVLLADNRKPVRLRLELQDEILRDLIDKALRATGNSVISESDPDLVFTDRLEAAQAHTGAWVFRLIADKDSQPYIGPFLLNRSHPLADGLALDGVVWAAGKQNGSPRIAGTAIVAAGNIPLLLDIERARGRHEVRMRFRRDQSTLQTSVNWPILLSNMLEWRSKQLPGLRRSNLSLGSEAVLILEPAQETVTILDPRKRRRQIQARDGSARVAAENTGVYEIHVPRGTLTGETYFFSSNALSWEESDLRKCGSGRWGNWADTTPGQEEQRSIAWVLLLLAMLLLTLHLALTQRLSRA